MLKKNFKKYVLILLIISITIYLAIRTYNSDLKISLENIKTIKSHKMKYILHWNYFWEIKLCLPVQFKNCPIDACFVTNNRSLMPIDKFDALIFHDPFSDYAVPKNRSINQKYIFFSDESPLTFGYGFQKNFYNLTLNYRRESDIHYPFGMIIKEGNNNRTVTISQIQNKTKPVAWLVSNCRTAAVKYRQNYVAEMQKYISIDIYGKCGNLTCPGRMSLECYNILDKTYKFYLAFENSLCKDYITEKTYNILKYTNMIPVVLGFADYKSLVPPHSVINADDFGSPKELVDYLLYLDKNLTEYMKYFEWKKDYIINDDPVHEMCCALCKKLHEPLVHSTYENLWTWAVGKNNSLCYNSQQLRTNISSS